MATKDIRTRLYNLLNEMTAVSGTRKTATPYIPQAALDDEGYIFRIRLQATTISKQSRENRKEVQAWLIECFSPSLQIGFSDLKEDAMYDYRDKVLNLFQANDGLTYEGAELAGIEKAFIVSDGFTWGTSELDFSGNGTQFRYKWQCTMSIEVIASCRE